MLEPLNAATGLRRQQCKLPRMGSVRISFLDYIMLHRKCTVHNPIILVHLYKPIQHDSKVYAYIYISIIVEYIIYWGPKWGYILYFLFKIIESYCIYSFALNHKPPFILSWSNLGKSARRFATRDVFLAFKCKVWKSNVSVAVGAFGTQGEVIVHVHGGHWTFGRNCTCRHVPFSLLRWFLYKYTMWFTMIYLFSHNFTYPVFWFQDASRFMLLMIQGSLQNLTSGADEEPSWRQRCVERLTPSLQRDTHTHIRILDWHDLTISQLRISEHVFFVTFQEFSPQFSPAVSFEEPR